MNKLTWYLWLILILAVAVLAAPAAMAANCGYTPTEVALYPSGIGFNPAVCYNLPNFAQSPNIRKFIDKLPGLGAANANGLGQYIPVATPDTASYPGSDYYELGIAQYTQKMNTDLPATTLRGYYQKDGTDHSKQYLGVAIIAKRNRPVRIKYFNELPVTSLTDTTVGKLFLPVDATLMGAAAGPTPGVNFTQNRTSVHLHGGRTPWISDGTPHQYITPAADPVAAAGGAVYQKGASNQNVPDMVSGGTVTCIGGAKCFTPTLSDGIGTLYYTNDQSARLMFYHDHALGITRLNVYAGLAAPYILTSQADEDLISGTNLSGGNPLGQQILPDQGTPNGVYRYGIPLVIQDKSFVNDATTPTPPGFPTATSGYIATSWTVTTDPLWYTYVTPTAAGGSLWMPHEYIPIENVFDPTGNTWDGRWDYGPFLNPPMVPTNLMLPSPTTVPEAFQDTATVNGTAFPYLELPPDAVRFRILSVGNDRAFNLSWFKADPLRINVTNGGTNYSAAPVVTITGNAGTYTSASAIVSPGTIASVDVAGSSHYIFPPTVTLNGGGGTCASVTASIVSNSSGIISVLAQGCTGYISAPTVSITGGGGGTYTTATATIIPKGVITGIIVTGAKGYRSDLAVPTVNITDSTGSGAAATAFVNTELAMVPAAYGISSNYPTWPGDGRDGGVPDPATSGPSWIQIGNESGFLAQAAIWPPNPIVYEQNRQSIPTLGVSYHSLLLQPAMRADVIVDFSGYKDGDVLILYNDGPAPMPGFWPLNDYYTDDPDQTGVGAAPSTPPGFGPNTRTIMQVRIKGNKTSAFTFNLANLQAALPKAFAVDQDKPIVPQLAYNDAFPGFATFDTYATNKDTTLNLTGTAQPIARILTTVGGNGYTTPPTVQILPKGPGSGATATAGLAPMGGVTLLTAGTGYTSTPLVTIGTATSTGTTGGGVTATVGATISGGGVASLVINEPGSNYSITTAPTCTISGGGGTGATCSTFVAVPDAVGSITLTSGGSGYTSEPLVYLIGGGGTGASADALLNGTLVMTGKNITEGFDTEYGRLDIRLGSTPNPLTPTVGNGQVIGIARYIDPPTEILNDGEVILWRIAHLGVDSHSLHFHLFDMQIVNHVDYTNVVKPPYPDELGWREVIRTNPQEDIIVALRPRSMVLPFPIPRSSRLLDITNLAGVNTNFLPIAPPPGIAAVPQVTNSITDFGWEYVWHCHLLAHEENDMMRPMVLLPPTSVPPTPTLAAAVVAAGKVTLNWTITPTFTNQVDGFDIQRCTGGGCSTFATLASMPLIDRNVRTYADTTVASGTTYRYRMYAFNNAGNSGNSAIQNAVQAAFGTPTVSITSPASGATYTAPATIPLVASATSGTGATITNVAFYYGTNLISTATTTPYTANWASVPVGVYPVTAVVTNSQGATATSAAITVNVEASVVATAATMISPVNGATLSTSQTFTWTNSGASMYQVWVGSTLGAFDLGYSPQTTATTATISGLAVNGSSVYVRLWSLVGATWTSNDYTYKASLLPGVATMLTPTNATTFAGASQTFTWTNAGASTYQVWVGSTLGAFDLGFSSQTTGTSATIAGLPTNGSVVHVRLWSLVSATWYFNDYTYTAAILTPAAMITPINGTTVSAANAIFTWNNVGASMYQVWVGSSAGTFNLGFSPQTTATTATITGLPTSGSLFVRLWSLFGTQWLSTDYTYTAGP